MENEVLKRLAALEEKVDALVKRERFEDTAGYHIIKLVIDSGIARMLLLGLGAVLAALGAYFGLTTPTPHSP